MKPFSVAFFLFCSWTLSCAQSSTQLNVNNASIKSSTNTVTVSQGITASGANILNRSNAVIMNSATMGQTSSNITISGATSSSPNISNTSISAVKLSNANTTVTPLNAISTTSSNTNITTASQITFTPKTPTEKLVAVKTYLDPQSRPKPEVMKPEVPKPESISNLYKNTNFQKANPIQFASATNSSAHNHETVIQLSRKINLAVSSEGLEPSKVTTAQLVDAIASPQPSLESKEFELSMLRK